jgi:hypothetical protein
MSLCSGWTINEFPAFANIRTLTVMFRVAYKIKVDKKG